MNKKTYIENKYYENSRKIWYDINIMWTNHKYHENLWIKLCYKT